MKDFFITFSIAILVVSESLGESPSFDYPYVESGYRSINFFVMVPNKAKPYGKCYQIDDNGNPILLWTVKGWYAYPRETCLSLSGKYLVRFMMPEKQESPRAELENRPFLEIYFDGNLKKMLLVKDLVDSKVDPIRLPNISELLISTTFSGLVAYPSIIFREKDDEQVKSLIPKDLDDSTEVFVIGISKAERVMINLKDGSIVIRYSN